MKLLLAVLLLSGLVYASDEMYAQGEGIYKKTCLACHGENGEADTDISFVVNPRNLKTTILNEEQSYLIIKEGAHYHGASSDIMPSFQSVYDESELRAVNHFITKSFNTESVERVNKTYNKSAQVPENKKAKMLKMGEKIYKRNCSWCHGPTGLGDGEATRNPEMSIFPYDLTKTLLDEKQIFLYMKYGGKHWGTAKDDMPSWKRKYNDVVLKSVAKYVNEKIKKTK